MIFTIFTIRRRGLRRIYSQIEIEEQSLELLYYSPFFRLAGARGRPRTIWHEETLNDYIQQAVFHGNHNSRGFLDYLEGNAVFSHKWIEKKEFYDVVVANKDGFAYAGYGEGA